MTTSVKREFIAKSYRLFKVLHQHLSILDIDFPTKRLVGYTELQIVSQGDELPFIRLNCQQCIIDCIYINDYMCEFTYSEPTADIVHSSEKKGARKLDSFSSIHYDVIKSTDSDLGNGELIIKVPELSDIKSLILERKTFSVNISYFIENPKGGIYFSVQETNNSNDDRNDVQEDQYMPHMFTYERSNLSRLWFPCVDSFSESCTWTILITCPEDYTAISSGELVEVEHNTSKKKKRFYYHLQIPTSASNIGLVVGKFTPIVHPDMHEVVHFCFPTLKSLLLDTCGNTHRIFEYYEDMLNTRYPYSTYKQVFVDNLDTQYVAFATLSIFSINLLHSKHIIEQAYATRKVLAQAIAEQYFGCFISMQSCPDSWLVRGIAGFLAHDYYKKAFGNNEYRYQVKEAMNKVINYEQQFRPIVLDPSHKGYTEKDYFHIKNFHTWSPLYDKMHRVKSFLIMRMLENYLGRALLLQVFNKMLSLAQSAITQKYNSNTWHHLYASTGSFIWAISTVTGKNIDTFLKQWVFQGGHVKLTGSFVFHRRRNTVQLEIRQVHVHKTGVWQYLGPLMIWLQELDGTFKHNLQIEDNVSKHDIVCHSKSRRNKKKKIPLCTGEEIDMDLSAMDQDSPVLWLRIDPEMNLLREVILEQPDYQWLYQLRYERDIIAQLESLAILDNYSTNSSIRNTLSEILSNDQIFYRVRCEAAFCLRKVANKVGSPYNGPQTMIKLFRKMFGSSSCQHIVRMNNFSNFKMYFIQKSLIVAMAGLRTDHGICPHEILRFLLDLFKYNDNSKNKFSDAYFRAAMIDALAETVTPVAITPIFNSNNLSDIVSQDTKNILEEIVRFFNLDKLLPSYKHVVTVSCLKAFRNLQKMGHLPPNSQIFRCHTSTACFVDVRKAAIEILIDILRAESRKEDLDFLLNLAIKDPHPAIRYFTLKKLIHNPPFSSNTEEVHQLDVEELVERLWTLMNSYFSCQFKLRCAIVDLYFVLYGRNRPKCLPKPEFSFVLNLKDKKASDENSDHNQMDLDNSMYENPLFTPNTNTAQISKPTTAEELFDRIKAADKPTEQHYSKVTVPSEMVKNEENLDSYQKNTENIIANSESTLQNVDILPEVAGDNFSELQQEGSVGDKRKKHCMDDMDPLLDSDGESGGGGREEGEVRTPSSYSHSLPTATSSTIPTISIRMKTDPSGDHICIKTTNEPSGSDYLHQSIKSLVSPPAIKKRKEDKDRSLKIGEEKDKNNKDRHHKDKKKKKKKKKHKHKHKDRHFEMGQSAD
uniref:Transcription initiation factor TFIID subunit 2 n=1 Tax=Dermatophagoides pteronyssinus TaxID=6956 RepID=A0A6P6Y2X7_DERPT|nr:transcription initiation factor TFIID subunit 2-like [Dermatophagoides pteronyssinus]